MTAHRHWRAIPTSYDITPAADRAGNVLGIFQGWWTSTRQCRIAQHLKGGPIAGRTPVRAVAGASLGMAAVC